MIVVRQLRRDFEAAEQDRERHTVQRLTPECLVVVTAVAARPGAGVARDLWVPTRALPWADLFDPFGAREPQWLGTKFTSRRKGEAMKGG